MLPCALTKPLSSDKAPPTDKVPGDSLQVIRRVLFLSHRSIYASISLSNIFIPPSLGVAMAAGVYFLCMPPAFEEIHKRKSIALTNFQSCDL